MAWIRRKLTSFSWNGKKSWSSILHDLQCSANVVILMHFMLLGSSLKTSTVWSYSLKLVFVQFILTSLHCSSFNFLARWLASPARLRQPTLKNVLNAYAVASEREEKGRQNSFIYDKCLPIMMLNSSIVFFEARDKMVNIFIIKHRCCRCFLYFSFRGKLKAGNEVC